MPKQPPLGPTTLKQKLACLSFRQLFEAGWPELLPIIPPRGRLPPNVDVRDNDWRGKSPGHVRHDGAWSGLPWRRATSNAEIVRAWDEMYANCPEAAGPQIGHRCGNLVVLDADIPDRDLAREAHGAVKRYLVEQCGVDPAAILTRQGNKPKWAMFFRMPPDEVARGWDTLFEHPRVTGPFGFQILGDGRQVVLWGEHPKTHDAYVWRPHDPHGYLELPQLTQAQLEPIPLEVVAPVIERLGGRLTRRSAHRHHDPAASPPDQESLAGDETHVTDAVRWIPNTDAVDYPQWIEIGMAIRAASLHWQEAGLRLWLEFCGRWTAQGRANAEAYAVEKWNSFRPPFHVGAQFLYDRAGEHGWNKAAADEGLRLLAQEAARTAERVQAPQLSWDQIPGPLIEARPQAESEGSTMAEKAVAHRFRVAYRSKLLYAAELGRWHGWTGKVWRADPSGSRGLLAQAHLHEFISAECDRYKASPAYAQLDDRQKASTMHRLRARKFQEYVSRFLPELFSVSAEWFDTQPHLLNTPSGCIDLRTGEGVELDATTIVTRITAYPVAPAGDPPPPRWDRFLKECTQGDADLASYLKRAMGYTLYGSLREHVLFYLFGDGGNGKSVFLDVVAELLGTYATVADRGVFLQAKYQDHSTTRASLAGYRYVMVPEVNELASWNDAVIKEWSAGNLVKARFIRADEFTFRPEGTLWFSGNTRPKLHRVDPAIERRMRLIEFMARPLRPDITLKETLLQEEGPRILRWLVDGCLEWQQQGLGSCTHVERATRGYLAEHDPLRAWARARCWLAADRDDPEVAREIARGRDFTTPSADLFADFMEWAREEMREAMTQRQFVQAVKGLPGVISSRTSNERRLKGIALRNSPAAGGETRAERIERAPTVLN